MIQLYLAALLAAAATASPYQSVSLLDDGSYQFFYETGEDAGSQYRSESRGPDGVVEGKYGYKDPTGEQRVVNYRADDFGYVAKGDVSVPGAPKGQFPAEPVEAEPSEKQEVSTEKHDEEKKPEESSDKKHEESKDEESKSSTEVEEEDDDMKDMELHESPADAPPEGFPVGFFGQNFQGLRRLPEPIKEEVKDQKKATSDEAKKDGEETSSKAGVDVHHDPHFASFAHPGWHGPLNYVPGAHQPVYVYSYQHPQAHGYYYFY